MHSALELTRTLRQVCLAVVLLSSLRPNGAQSATLVLCRRSGSSGPLCGLPVKSKGRASQPTSGQLQHTVSLQIFSNEPSDGSIGGGTTVNVTGTGFPDSVEAWNGNAANIGGYPCTIVESTFNWFTCITSSSSSSRRRKRQSDSISISFGNETKEFTDVEISMD